MNVSTQFQCFIHKNLALFIGVGLCLYFSYHMVNGGRSYSRLSLLTQISEQQKNDLSALKAEHFALEKKVVMMRPGSMSADLAEEQIRKYLGYHHKDEMIVVRH